jgi:hypothetical protein
MINKTPFLLALCLLAGLVLIACGGGSSDNAANTSNTAAGNANKTAANTSTATTSGEKVGVAECDDFLAKYEACVSGKVPAAAQAAFKTSLETWRKSWKELAGTPQGKAGLAQACKAAADQAKAQLGSYGCSW